MLLVISHYWFHTSDFQVTVAVKSTVRASEFQYIASKSITICCIFDVFLVPFNNFARKKYSLKNYINHHYHHYLYQYHQCHHYQYQYHQCHHYQYQYHQYNHYHHHHHHHQYHRYQNQYHQNLHFICKFVST